MKGRIGPYRISERLGTGGMGEVFKAFDDRLDRWVAIKRIRPGKEDTDQNRERFLREARATAQLNHPAIVHVYDIFRDGESDCIVMEYIEGRTLQSMTADGPLDPMHATALGREIAEGLSEAHAKGILHRDLKTENIIVTPDGHAKILDFGLAKPLISDELDPSLTGKGQLVGTSRAMSPEYVGGDNIDHRSDIFSLGVLLYESITGKSPFKAQNTLATLKQVIVHQQAPSREINPEVSQELSDLVDSLLEKSPEDRPQSAKEVAGGLGRLCGQVSSESIARAGSGSHSYSSIEEEWSLSSTMVDPRLRRYWIALLAVVVIALTCAYFLGKRSKGPTIEPGMEVLIVLGEFENRTNEPLLEDSLDYAFRIGLEQSRQINILSANQIRDSLMRMRRDPDTPIARDIGLEICQREQAQALVIGSIIKLGEVYSISAEIIDPENESDTYVTTTTAANHSEILSAFETLTQDILLHLGESVGDGEETLSLEKVTTSDLAALKAYSKGVKHFERRDYDASEPLLLKAIEIDTSFATAQAKLGQLYINTGRSKKAAEHLQVALDNSERLTEYERLYLQYVVARQKGAISELVDALSLLSDLYEDRFVPIYNLGIAKRFYLQDFKGAGEHLAAAAEAKDAQSRLRDSAFYHLGYCHLALEQSDNSLEAFGKIATHDLRVHTEAEVFIATGQYDKALSYITDPEGDIADPEGDITDPEGEIASNIKGLHAVDRGAFAEALSYLNAEASSSSNQNLNDFVNLKSGELPLLAQSAPEYFLQELASTTDQVISLLKSLTEISDEGIDSYAYVPKISILGKMCARNSYVARARQLLGFLDSYESMQEIKSWQSFIRILEAEIMAAEGDIRQALETAKTANTGIELFSGRESLAYLYLMNGDTEAARKQYEWMIGRRGLAFSDCLDERYCGGFRRQDIIDWALALYHVGRIHEQVNQPAAAISYYERLLDHWQPGDPTNRIRQDTLARLKAVKETAAANNNSSH